MASRKSAHRLQQLSSHFRADAPEAKRATLSSEIKLLLFEGHDDEAAQKALSAFLQPPRYKARPEQLSILERAETSTFISDGAAITQYVWNPNSNTSLILTHGFGTCTAFLAQPIQHLLSTTPHRIVAIDHAAHGASSGSETSFGQFILTLKHLVQRELDEGKHVKALIGHSVGATAMFMLYYLHPSVFQKQGSKAAIIALNPPLQPTTLMQGFCAQHKLPQDLVVGMRAAFQPSPEDVLKLKIGESGCFRGVRVLLVQDQSDKIAVPGETEVLAGLLERGGAVVRVERTSGLGHFKIVSDGEVLGMVARECV
ncbi:Alpha/Beta hydrolase protein [Lophiotrema nucula]|uniref:Alpha/Beta hydrolase protein n=1 Tax=Lophiotrema nucula TaxID=690887 RepID=A0A6A5YNG9_9PLEO|nr:Alpha/Beta hydrolase protein [Lophiotrema nucula]